MKTTSDQSGSSNFTEQLEALLAGSHLSLKDRTDDIEVYLMSLEDVSLVYNVQTTNITKVVSFKRQKGKIQLAGKYKSRNRISTFYENSAIPLNDYYTL